MSAVFLLLIVLLVAPLAALPAGAVDGGDPLHLVAWSLIDFHHIGEIIKRHKRERIILALTFVGTLIRSGKRHLPRHPWCRCYSICTAPRSRRSASWCRPTAERDKPAPQVRAGQRGMRRNVRR